MKKSTGFTLVEIMIVVAIIAVLAAIAIPQLITSRKMSTQSRCINNMKAIEAAKSQYALGAGLDSEAALDGTQLVEASAFLKDAAQSFCPLGGSPHNYDYMGLPVSCSIHGLITNPTPLSNLTD